MKKYEFEQKKLLNLLNKDIYELMREHNAVIAGGAITSLFTRNEINDIDIYFRNRKDMASFVEDAIEDGSWIISYTSKAVMFSVDNQEYQAITFREFSNIDELFNTFDFTVCMGAYDCKKESFTFHEDFMQHNAQKILKFNQNTAFPIISSLRVDKYKKKGYTISKPDFIKVILACMNLEVNTVEELKEQIGGMYGYNVDKLIEGVEVFSLRAIMEKISEIEVDDSYFNMPDEKETDFDIELISIEILGKENATYIKRGDDDYLVLSPSKRIIEYGDTPPSTATILNPNNALKGFKCYKFVKQVGDKLVSHYDNEFTYEIGETVIPKVNKSSRWKEANSGKIHVGLKQKWPRFTYSNYGDSVMIEIEIESLQDVTDCMVDNIFTISKGKVLRVVPKEEYENYASEDDYNIFELLDI